MNRKKFISGLCAATAVLLIRTNSALGWMSPAMTGGGASIAAASYLVDEGFDTATDPTPTSGWTEVSGTVDWDYTPSLASTYSVQITAPTAATVYVYLDTISGATEMWGHLLVKFGTAPSSSAEIFKLQDSVGTQLGLIKQSSAGYLMAAQNNFSNTGSVDVSSSERRIWWHYVIGTGANAKFQVWQTLIGTTTRPGSVDVERTDGTSSTETGEEIRLQASETRTNIFDHVIVSNSEFTSVTD